VPVALPVPEAPMEVPPPVLVLAPVEPVLEPLAVVSVLLVLGVVLLPELEPVMLPLPLVLGEVVEGEVLEVLDELEQRRCRPSCRRRTGTGRPSGPGPRIGPSGT
jgi:hypothetical protein